MSGASVTMIGNFPPPLGGAAFVNESVWKSLVDAGIPVTRVNVSGPTLTHNRSLSYHARRSARNFVGLKRARAAGSLGATLYIVPDAGLGAWYTRAHIVGAAGRYGAVMIHHHSCRYIEQRDDAIAAVTTAAGQHATHVFLTEGMAANYQRQYGDVNFRVATNARFVADEAERPAASRPSGPIRIGHLSNLSRDKGFFAVADAFDTIRSVGVDATLALAGPTLGQEVEDRLADIRRKHGSAVSYLGPLSGNAKAEFYREIDLFLFPTAFKQEAAPLVIYEALAAGCPVLATDRGVISEIVPAVGGAVCGRDDDFSAFTLQHIRSQQWDQESRNLRSDQIKEWIRVEATTSLAQYGAVLRQLAEGPRPGNAA
ncbi:glycosyltransferase family 4 protein [Mycobacterium sp. SA01]|uniref:glycosyltransferase family 4 protein n=1 Tax=Mycobacterium sp. SA01 TaxID=3238820 RepID=UPI00351B25E0